jgi:RNA polymerase sigma-70 factor (ECF subfamily)
MGTDYLNNKTLVEHLKKGNEGAYIFLIDTYHKKLCVYAKSLCRDVYLAEDIVQNVFENVWKKRKGLKEMYSVKSYLYKSVYNEFIDQYRKKNSLLALEKKYNETLKNILEEDNTNELDNLITLVKKEIEELPPKCKTVFVLGKQEGLTYIEIAEHLDISFRTVENQMSKAFAIIREKVSGKINPILFLMFRIRSRNVI